VKAGKLRALMSREPPLDSCRVRSFRFALSGTGIPGWHGIFATGGRHKPILDKLAADVRAVLALPA